MIDRTGTKRFAILVDADNIGPQYIDQIMEITAEFGIATYKRVYGDFTKPVVVGWRTAAVRQAFIPVQNFCAVDRKNSTDIALVIDAMDILHRGDVDGFMIVSSDSDFSRLALRLRESGMEVVGVGGQISNHSFRNSCSYFKVLQEVPSPYKMRLTRNNTLVMDESEIKKAVEEIIVSNSVDGGSLTASFVVSKLMEKFPDYDPKKYGYLKTGDFLLHLGFAVETVPDVNNIKCPNCKIVYVNISRPDRGVSDDRVLCAIPAEETPPEPEEAPEADDIPEREDGSAEMTSEADDAPEHGDAPVEITPEMMKVSDLVRRILREHCANGEAMNATDLGNYIRYSMPDFRPKDYGFMKLGPMLEALGFETIRKKDVRNRQCPGAVVLYVKP